MSRIIFLFLVGFICSVSSVFAKDGADKYKDDVKEVEDYLNSITNFTAHFNQVDDLEERSEGVFYLSRPGKLRWEYYPPNPVLILSNGSLFTYYDIELDEVSHISIDDNILGVLTRKHVSFSQNKIKILNIQKNDDKLEITLGQEDKEDEGQLTLIFKTGKIELRGLRVVDAIGKVVNVEFSGVAYDQPIDKSLFYMPLDRKRNRRE
jgi:outer membrane lipoprotein-sorting protein